MRNQYWWDPINVILRAYNHLQSTRKDSTRVQLKREYKRIHHLTMNLLYTQQMADVNLWENSGSNFRPLLPPPQMHLYMHLTVLDRILIYIPLFWELAVAGGLFLVCQVWFRTLSLQQNKMTQILFWYLFLYRNTLS